MTRVVLAGLAATRLVRALQHEKVGQPWQDYVDRLRSPVITRGRLDVEATARGERIADFLSCDHCLGFWVTLAMVLLHRTRARPLVEALAAATIVSAAVEHYPNWKMTSAYDA